jgi:hypothetical protein
MFLSFNNGAVWKAARSLQTAAWFAILSHLWQTSATFYLPAAGFCFNWVIDYYPIDYCPS